VADLPEFQRKQYEFAAHIRDPEKNAAPPGIEDRRLAIYRDLFFNNQGIPGVSGAGAHAASG
jgi:hypothetical protein